MTTRFALLSVIALAVAACSSDTTTPTGPTRLPAPQFVIAEANAPSGAHYSQGFGDPTCSVVGLIVSCSATRIGGVGNTDADLLLDVDFSATVQCRNNGGKIVDVKTQVTSAAPAPDDATDVRNGTLFVSSISNTLSAPSTQSFLNAATCPNGNWDKLLVEGSPEITSFTYSLTFEGFTQPAILVTGP